MYKITDDLALVQTVDFFTPTVDDPFTFGQIAAVNALNDIYAMGGTPLTAMNIVCFPIKALDKSVLRDVAQGLDKMREARRAPGRRPQRGRQRNQVWSVGDRHNSSGPRAVQPRRPPRLILTKPLGTGIVTHDDIKARAAGQTLVEQAARCVTTLNKKAAELIAAGDIHSCTDITGFGFLGTPVK